MFDPIIARNLTLIMMLSFSNSLATAEEGLVTPAGLMKSEGVELIQRYICSENQRCALECAAGPGHITVERSGIRRVEVSLSQTMRIVSAVYVDAVGKPHQSLFLLPRPASCAFDNLEMMDSLRVNNGEVEHASKASQEVIFDLVPGSD